MTDTPNTTQGKGAVDWSRPIEAVHEDGRVEVATATLRAPDGFFWVRWKNNAGWSDCEGACGQDHEGWRIRNVPEHPTPTQYAPELVERMVALCRGMVHTTSVSVTVFPSLSSMDHYAIARSILSDLPQEVDPDEQYAEQLIKEMGWAGEAEIGEVAVRRLVAKAYAAGRQLQRGEAA